MFVREFFDDDDCEVIFLAGGGLQRPFLLLRHDSVMMLVVGRGDFLPLLLVDGKGMGGGAIALTIREMDFAVALSFYICTPF